jgi:hypothetical protein
MKIWQMINAGDAAGIAKRMAELDANLDQRLGSTALVATPKTKRRTVKRVPAAALPSYGYAREIAMLAPRALSTDEIRWVEAWMRVEHSTLNHLSRAQAKKEIDIALECIAASPASDSERLAQSFGL